MTTSKLPSGKWRTRVYIDGKQISFTATTRAESVRLATQASNLRNCSRMTINAALRGYYEAKKGHPVPIDCERVCTEHRKRFPRHRTHSHR